MARLAVVEQTEEERLFDIIENLIEELDEAGALTRLNLTYLGLTEKDINELKRRGML